MIYLPLFAICLALRKKCVRAKDRCRCRKVSERVTMFLLEEFFDAKGMTRSQFEGMEAEKLFDVSINFFQLSNKDYDVALICRSDAKWTTVMDVLLYDRHYCYVKDLTRLCKSFSCPRCGVCLTGLFSLTRHRCNAAEVSKVRFPRGAIRLGKTICDKIEEELGVPIPYNMRFYPYQIMFDLPTYLPKSELLSNTSTMKHNNRHELLSV